MNNLNTNTPLTDDTYQELANAAEYNKEQRLASIKKTWKFTNCCLFIIAIYCFLQVVKEVITLFVLYNAGIKITELLNLLRYS